MNFRVSIMDPAERATRSTEVFDWLISTQSDNMARQLLSPETFGLINELERDGSSVFDVLFWIIDIWL